MTKLSPDGSAFAYSTYLGGDRYTYGLGIAVSGGNAYVTGLTTSSSISFPLVGAIQSTQAGIPDAFVTILSPTASSLLFSTFLGGSAYDEGTSIALDATGNLFVTGDTGSTNFPTQNASQPTYGGGDADAFVVQLLLATTVTLSPSPLNVPAQPVGTPSPAQPVTLTNTGSAPLTINSISITGTDSGDFTQTNNCPVSPATLAVTASCTINVIFTPTAPFTRTATLEVSGNISGGPATLSLTGTGLAPVASVSPTSVNFPNQQVGTPSTPQAVTLSNTGNAPLTISSITTTGTNSGDFAPTSSCPISPATLAANASCVINVTFTPTAPFSRTATLAISDNSFGSAQQDVSLAGVGLAPVASLSATSVNFPNQHVGTASTPQAVTLSNTGNEPMTISSITITGTNSGDFARTSNCPVSPATLAVNASCAINVTFTPTAPFTRTATLLISDNAFGGPQQITLTGIGTAPEASLLPSSLTFANQQVKTASAPQPLALSNPGNEPLTISSIVITDGSGKGSSLFTQTNNCPVSPATLAANASCTINVTFTPQNTGTQTATLTVSDNAFGSPRQTASLSGNGAKPMGSISPTSLVFPPQLVGTTSAAQTVTLSNAGNGSLTVKNIKIDDSVGNFTDFAATNNCPASLAPGASCTVSVTFTPTATGIRIAALLIVDSDPQAQSVSLTGTGQ